MAREQRNALKPGAELDGYQIREVLGAGAFGITYAAYEPALDRTVAIKEYLPNSFAMRAEDGSTVQPLSEADRPDYDFGLERFRGEARTLVNFHHPNIVTVFRLVEANGTAYLVMQYVAGETLQEILHREGTLPEAELLEILEPLLDGLEKVHEASFLHRDIKPGNIFIQADGSPVLLDFGAARQALGEKSQSLTNIFTPGYAPFEQYTSRGNQGPWTDIYGLGATLYRGVTGERPPDAHDRVVDDIYVPATEAAKGKYGMRFLKAIDAALSTEPEKRPKDVAAWRALFGWGAGKTRSTRMDVGAAPDASGPAATPAAGAGGKRRVAPVLAGLLLLGVLGGGAYALWGTGESSEKAKAWKVKTQIADSTTRKGTERQRPEVGAARPKVGAARPAIPRGGRAKGASPAAAEEAKRKAAEEARRKAEAEASRKAAEEAKRKAAEEAKRKAAEEARRKAAEETKRKAAAEARRKAIEEAKRKAAEEARRKAATEAARRKAAEEARRRQLAAVPGRLNGAQIRALLTSRRARLTRRSRRGPGSVVLTMRFEPGGSLVADCQFAPDRNPSALRPCRRVPPPGGWLVTGDRLCLQMRRRGCFYVERGRGQYNFRSPSGQGRFLSGPFRVMR